MVGGIPFVYTYRLCMCIALNICGHVGGFIIAVYHLFFFVPDTVCVISQASSRLSCRPSFCCHPLTTWQPQSVRCSHRSELSLPPWLWIINSTVCQCRRGLMNAAKWNYTFKTIMYDWDKLWQQRVCILAEVSPAVSVVGRLVISQLLTFLSVPKIDAYYKINET